MVVKFDKFEIRDDGFYYDSSFVGKGVDEVVKKFSASAGEDIDYLKVLLIALQNKNT